MKIEMDTLPFKNWILFGHVEQGLWGGILKTVLAWKTRGPSGNTAHGNKIRSAQRPTPIRGVRVEDNTKFGILKMVLGTKITRKFNTALAIG